MVPSAMKTLLRFDGSDLMLNPREIRSLLQGFTVAVLATTVGIVPGLVLSSGSGAKVTMSSALPADEFESKMPPVAVVPVVKEIPCHRLVVTRATGVLSRPKPPVSDSRVQGNNHHHNGVSVERISTKTRDSLPRLVALAPAVKSGTHATLSSPTLVKKAESIRLTPPKVAKVESKSTAQAADMWEPQWSGEYQKHASQTNTSSTGSSEQPVDSPFETAASSGSSASYRLPNVPDVRSKVASIRPIALQKPVTQENTAAHTVTFEPARRY